MAAETLVALAVVAVLAFVAGWIARGRGDSATPADPDLEVAAEPIVDPSPSHEATRPPIVKRPVPGLLSDPSPAVAAPDPAAATVRLLDRAVAAYEAAVERWLDEGADISPAGRAALGELDRAIQRVDVAASRIDEGTEARFSALDALDGLREASKLLQPYREGGTLDRPTSRELDRVESEIQAARDGLAT